MIRYCNSVILTWLWFDGRNICRSKDSASLLHYRLLYRKKMKHGRAYQLSTRQHQSQSTEYLNATYEEPSRYQPSSNVYMGLGAATISKKEMHDSKLMDEHQSEPASGSGFITREPPAYETLIETRPPPTEPST